MHYYSFYFSIITYIRFQNFFPSNYFCKCHSLKDLKGPANFTAPFIHMKKLYFQITLHYTQDLPTALSMLHSFYNPAHQSHWQATWPYYTALCILQLFCLPHGAICQKRFHINDKNSLVFHYLWLKTPAHANLHLRAQLFNAAATHLSPAEPRGPVTEAAGHSLSELVRRKAT